MTEKVIVYNIYRYYSVYYLLIVFKNILFVCIIQYFI